MSVRVVCRVLAVVAGAFCILLPAGCGSTAADDDPGADGAAGGDGATSGRDDGGASDGDGSVPPVAEDSLSTATGCGGVFNPDQVLDFHLQMSAGDWSSLKADSTNSVLFSAQFHCNDEPALPYPIAVRRKRSGGTDKPAVKIDFNELEVGGDFQTLEKMSLESGISEGSGSAEMLDVAAEYLAWRLMYGSGAFASRAAVARLFVNDVLIGTYVDVEQVDKRFLESRLGEDSGWLYKKSGSPSDGYKTNEAQANPYEQYFCFWDNNPCAAPSATELETDLPAHLEIEQMLGLGAVNAIIGNSDAPLVKNNNYYFYDSGIRGRIYLPWDLDTTMKDVSLFGTGTTLYTDVLFTHWEDDYHALATQLLDGPLALSVIHGEIARMAAVAGAALDSDPGIGGSSADVAADLDAWWTARHAALVAELEAHTP
jgi:CotH protein